ncbi:heparan-alpha-glucosaminide N-acetyltransferase-like [Daphnia pulicaria]|uniref:heparan-alpha-glucosaminide N-acetyltransferase-like n=1 Tax=Daphnia pulicaria TaxID=35523 RepID=UPI001EEBECE7|nr:heparan-alpha-glucosaminide N-acetyltransferase-like [Daphnia pulicaria]XP_046657309.1 heparan-alpha-glucosaminide N-acetyltransferase-like [Daphnia pulicaria]XP_046657310.1 heparan-alpha-glucosaminide N-acetyltransferase-like [Daphnia pulicaria]
MPKLFEDPGVDEFRGLNLRNLKIDEAWMVVTSHLPRPTWLYVLSDDCAQCAFKLLSSVGAGSNNSLKMDATHGLTLRFRDDNSSTYAPQLGDSNNTLCQVHVTMGEFGVYDVNLDSTDAGRIDCRFSTAKEPVDIYAPLLACFLFYVVLAFLWIGVRAVLRRGYFDGCLCALKLKKRQKKTSVEGNENPGGLAAPTIVPAVADEIAPKKKSSRLKSLDTFRGITIVLMIFVNDGAGQYFIFQHATWNGLQLADVIFPWFMWIMGVCMPISLRSSLRRKESKLTIFAGILRRSCLLFFLGIMNNSLGGPVDLGRLRVPGVLQRFAITYLAVGTAGLLLTPADLSAPHPSSKVRKMFQDIVVLWPQWILFLLLVAAHCFITFFLPVEEGCPVGYLGPAGLHLDNAYPGHCIGGAAGYIDRLILSVQHIFNKPTTIGVYGSGPYDPEGILGSMLCTFQVFLGAQAGMTLLIFSGWKSRLIRWLAWSVLTGLIGALLCLASQNDGWIPVNKNLWSLSFVLVTTSLAFFLLGACYWLIDVREWWNGAPFLYPGMNGILMYLGHQGAYSLFPWHWEYGPMNTHFAKLVETLWGVSLWVLTATWLYHKKIFLAL